jgi:hypothetical protein
MAEVAVNRDIDPIELLILWHRYESQWLPVEGYPSECPSTRGYQASRQYDGDNGAADAEEYGRLARHIGSIVRQIEDPHRTALCILAANRSSGAAVWRSVILPNDKDELAHLMAEAVDMFMARI